MSVSKCSASGTMPSCARVVQFESLREDHARRYSVGTPRDCVLSSTEKTAAHGGLMGRMDTTFSAPRTRPRGNGQWQDDTGSSLGRQKEWLKEMAENPGYHPTLKSPLQDARAERVGRERRRRMPKEKSKSDGTDDPKDTKTRPRGDESLPSYSYYSLGKQGNPSWSFMTPERDKAFRSFSSILLGVKETRRWIDGTPPVGHYRPKYDLIEPSILSPDIRLHVKHEGRKPTPVSKKSHRLVSKSAEKDVASSSLLSTDDGQHEIKDVSRKLFGGVQDPKTAEDSTEHSIHHTASYDMSDEGTRSMESPFLHPALQGRHRRSRTVLGIGPSEMKSLRATIEKVGFSGQSQSGRKHLRGIMSMDSGVDEEESRYVEKAPEIKETKETKGEEDAGKGGLVEENDEEKKKKKKKEGEEKKVSSFLSINAKEKREKRPVGGWAFRSTTPIASQKEVHLETPDKYYEIEEGLKVIENRPDVVTSLAWEKMADVSRDSGGSAVMYGGIADPVDKPRPRTHSGIVFEKQTTREVASTLIATQMSRKEPVWTSTSRQVEDQEYPAKGYYRDISWHSLERTSRHLRTPSPVNMRRMRPRMMDVEEVDDHVVVETEDLTASKKDKPHPFLRTASRSSLRSPDPVVHEVREAMMEASIPSVHQVERGERILSTRKRTPVLVDMGKQTSRPSPILTHVNTHLDHGDAKSPTVISPSPGVIAFERMGGRKRELLITSNSPATDFYDGKRTFVEPRSPSVVMKPATKKKLPMQTRERMKREKREDREKAREKEIMLHRERQRRMKRKQR
eukprot:TRINITY_DN2613_c0_g1_i1.p1 TRINITY_DN2613_c0_g1~~TRINITY_DN2613_c0_g1_i1.p1  ORF type:complete len:845 (+),score=236.60 TRINITY_DN2613_c0_g1_i1:154-2535(+)